MWSFPDGHWRQTPPAVFPVLFGLIGLGLAWRSAAVALPFANVISALILLAAAWIYGVALVRYFAKVKARPAAFVEDLKLVPGRAGLSAMSLSMFLIAAALVPVAPLIAQIFLFAMILFHGGLAVFVIRAILASPADQRAITPVWHLSFVGFILAPLAAVPLGYTQISTGILMITIGVAAMIWGASFAQFMNRKPTPALRPLLAIHLAPASLFTTVSAGLGFIELAVLFGVLAIALLIALIGCFRWLTVAGFSPLWGAFTFPLAAVTTAMFALAPLIPMVAVLAWVLLTVATLMIPLIAYRVLSMWVSGVLAEKTGASRA